MLVRRRVREHFAPCASHALHRANNQFAMWAAPTETAPPARRTVLRDFTKGLAFVMLERSVFGIPIPVKSRNKSASSGTTASVEARDLLRNAANSGGPPMVRAKGIVGWP
mmetsp:Transcript_92332/g.265642  ORF Transcript_92332/g.265642 Transcript_92332/m.265642 type:complete len:110 (-) Transcript_92332:43-372(-)